MATYNGIKQATCLHCGVITLDISSLEIMNDLSPECVICGLHLVAWFTNEGTVITWEDKEGESHRLELHEKETKIVDPLDEESLFTHLLEDFSEVIRKHFPNFDNNIEEETWKLLQLFTDETIAQLTEKETN